MIKKIAKLTLILIFAFCNIALGVTLLDYDPGEDIPSQNIKIKTHGDGTLDYLTYIIASTGATSGIRYRTSAITITIGGHTATIDISAMVGGVSAGESVYSQIVVTKEDIIGAIGEQYRSEVEQANPENVTIGANIQIYNAGTGAVLATIINRDDVASIAGNIGFGSKDIEDMKTRWQQNSGSGSTVIIEEEDPPKPGLRPSVLVN